MPESNNVTNLIEDTNAEKNEQNGLENTTNNNEENNENNQVEKVEKKYQVISNVVFKYGILIVTIIICIIIFFIGIKKRKTLTFNNEYEIQKIGLVGQYKNSQEKNDEYKNDTNLNILIRQGTLEISNNLLQSSNNLITYKGITLPKRTFLYEQDEIKDIEYFKNPNYDILELEKIVNELIYVNYSEIGSQEEKEIKLLPLKNNSIEETFFVSCANKHKIFNGICNIYIDNFLDGYYVYNVSDDYPGLTKTLNSIIGRKKYKDATCESIGNLIKYTHVAPTEIESLAITCGNNFYEKFNMIQDFGKVTTDLENKYIGPETSKYKEINEYKLISYQQILYNNIINNIAPYEGTYKNYTNYLSKLLKKSNNELINQFYYDITYWFNNFYLIPELNKIKYQSTQSKREEIEGIISDLEGINNGNEIEGYIGLKDKIISNALQEEVKKIGSRITNTNDDTTNALLKSLKKWNNLKIVKDEINGKIVSIIGYFGFKLENGEYSPVLIQATLENKNGVLIVNDIATQLDDKTNLTLLVMIKERDYTLPEIYDFLNRSVGISSIEKMETPCETIKRTLQNNNGLIDILYCDKDKINIINGEPGNQVLYQIKMNNYSITSINATDQDILAYINKSFSGVKTNQYNIAQVLSSIVSYKIDDKLKGNNNAIIAVNDLESYLGTKIIDIGEKSGKVAAEFNIAGIPFIGIYDVETKILGPIFLDLETEDGGSEEKMYKNFSLKLTEENQNEINRFLINPVEYLGEIDEKLTAKYYVELLVLYLGEKAFNNN